LYEDGAAAHRAHKIVILLKAVTPDFIPPNLRSPNSPHLNPVHYKMWGMLQEWPVYKTKIKDVHELCNNALRTSGVSWISALSSKLLKSGKRDLEDVWLQKENSLNIRREHFSLLTLCHVLFWKVDSLPVCTSLSLLVD